MSILTNMVLEESMKTRENGVLFPLGSVGEEPELRPTCHMIQFGEMQIV